ncbi:MAG: cytochrome c [Gammaproteobacteria bacterium]
MTRLYSAPALALLLAALVPSPAVAGDPVAGKALSATCVACHGVNGISPNPMWPNLAGQKEQYLIKQLTSLRDGERQNELMTPIAMNLSDEDIENLAAHFSGLKPCGGP